MSEQFLGMSWVVFISFLTEERRLNLSVDRTMRLVFKCHKRFWGFFLTTNYKAEIDVGDADNRNNNHLTNNL